MNDSSEARDLAIAAYEQQTQPALLAAARTLKGGLGASEPRVDPELYLRLTQETERIGRAATVLAAAQLLSNGYSARFISQVRGVSQSNFPKDRLWSQLAPLADTITAARNAGDTHLATVAIEVPLNRSDVQTYTFHDVPTGL